MESTELVPVVNLVNGQLCVSSVDVASKFHKKHKDVLRLIKQTTSELPENFNGRNFAPVEYTDSKGEKRPAFNLTRDGFTLLAMEFTGKEALQWKIKYIEAFNSMEQELLKRTTQINYNLIAQIIDDKISALKNELMSNKEKTIIKPQNLSKPNLLSATELGWTLD